MRFQALSAAILLALIFTGAPAAKAGSVSRDGVLSCLMRDLEFEILGPTAEERQLLAEVQGDLRKIRPLDVNESKSQNAEVLNALENLPISKPSRTSKRKGTFSQDELKRLSQEVRSNPQVKKTLCGGPKNGGYANSENGFCYVRAAAVHMLTLQSGGTNGNIKKIFVMGNLSDGKGKGIEDRFWFHAATTVRKDNGEWIVIDPDLPKDLPLRAWHEKMLSWDTDGKMRLFVTPAGKLYPVGLKKYSRRLIENGSEFYADFLDELYIRSTGRPGPWHKLRSERKRKKLIQDALLWLGTGGAVGAGAYFLPRQEQQAR